MKKNFTLIELLVVVAILGILSSILLPSLSSARKKSRETLSISNLKQIYIGMTMYADDNDEYIPNATNFTTGRHWPFYIYNSIGPSLTAQGSNGSAISNAMQTSSYSKVMYCPIVSQVRGGISVHSMGRTDYGLNKYFRIGGYKKFSAAAEGGKLEPIIVPIQNPSNPELWSTSLGTASKDAAYYFGNNTKTIGLYIHGNVKYFSIAHGSSMDTEIKNGNSLK